MIYLDSSSLLKWLWNEPDSSAVIDAVGREETVIISKQQARRSKRVFKFYTLDCKGIKRAAAFCPIRFRHPPQNSIVTLPQPFKLAVPNS